MDVVTYSAARKNLKAVMDRVVDDSDFTVITRQNGKPVVLLSLEDWSAMQETAHLLSTRANAEHLRESIKEAERGETTLRELIKDN